MFNPTSKASIFGMPLGVDFAQVLVEGLLDRLKANPPEAIARVELYVNTTRMQRRVRRLLADHGALLLPQIKLITDLASDPRVDLPPATDGLGRRLELTQLVRALIAQEPNIAAKDAAFDLADSLASLLDEMQGEAVTLEQITGLDVSNHSEHWKRSQRFFELLAPYLDADADQDNQGRMRAVVSALEAKWHEAPPAHPIIVAGSTGSRGTTRAFMNVVSRLPQGALVLPGVDFDMPDPIWEMLETDGEDTDDRQSLEDHPQYRCLRLLKDLDLTTQDLHPWTTTSRPACPGRNKLVSLALRPAPVTDAWLDEGPKLSGLEGATEAITLVEAPSARIEALTIALRLRQAAEDKLTAALVTPDQTLARRVTAALSAWQIVPNDSAGARLDLSLPGRLLRQTVRILGKEIAPEHLLALLKHPLVGAADRTAHLSKTRDLELKVLRGGPASVTKTHCQKWAEDREADDPGTIAWNIWLWSILEPLSAAKPDDLSALVELHHRLSDQLTRGPTSSETSELWTKRAGEAALATMLKLGEVSAKGGIYAPSEYGDLLDGLLAREEVRNPYFTHPDIMIWGTLEARVQGADLVILAGLNDGSWPAMPPPDPWLNRDMRKEARLLVPEGRIGLSAHDFQQAIAAPQVWLTRSVRDAEAETVQSRWLNRIQNLLTGLPVEGEQAFKSMQKRGKHWVKMAQSYDTPRIKLHKAPRPAPQPPAEARPKELWVTHIETLIRDPYAVYARHILGLKPLRPLHARADAALRGDVIHKLLQTFISTYRTELPEDAEDALLSLATRFFEEHISWPATRIFWLAKLSHVVPWFVQSERARRAFGHPEAFEADGVRKLDSIDFTLKGRADRIDRDASGRLSVFDYKTGALPTHKEQTHFKKQLPLLAALGAQNGYEGFPGSTVWRAGYIGLGSTPKEDVQEFEPSELDHFWSEFETLITEYMDPTKGYTARRAVYEDRWDQDYDILSRFGEWDRTTQPTKQRVGQ